MIAVISVNVIVASVFAMYVATLSTVPLLAFSELPNHCDFLIAPNVECRWDMLFVSAMCHLSVMTTFCRGHVCRHRAQDKGPDKS